MRCRGTTLTLERMARGTRPSCGRPLARVATMPACIVPPGASSGLRGSASLLRRWQFDTCSSRLCQADRDRLFARAGAMHALADVLHRCADELAGLGARGFAGTLVCSCTLHCLSFRHVNLLWSLIDARAWVKRAQSANADNFGDRDERCCAARKRD